MIDEHISCPALVVAAPSSGSGKTTVVAALARYFTNLGKKVRVFKTGPDFIDPNFLAFASHQPVYQLDFWMCGEQHCRRLVAEAAKEADLILIEGVMGMFDGQCSSADIAAKLGIPVLAVINAGAMAQTFGAIAYGLANFRQDISMYGVVANRVGSTGHAEMLKEALPDTLEFCGYLQKDIGLSLPERHLGLVQAQELDDLDDRLNLAADLISQHVNLKLPPKSQFVPVASAKPERRLEGITIAIAQDTAFSFIYQANLDLLTALGAKLSFFSPIQGDELPDCDALYLPGGYPELYLKELAENTILKQQVHAHVNNHKPVLAECGGMLYLNNSLTDIEGKSGEMCGILNANSRMQGSLAALGLVEGELLPGETLRGHTFHYSKTDSSEEIACHPVSQRGRKLDPVWRHKQVIASYIHWYFPSNPELVANIFKGAL
ncbi:cobyrinate a,c-diamide synthase [Photobacterium sp. SDRW27]|uniref:cobyrinate a,c-diamide synthase n=1 Tax=Photobacterium obscurum TaxID=2829490 RepID=UPI0022448491|nr:cobyrinate a,c-diamide synthase [Photobacterium obscurum]MCW8329136.1 cobyrinate a,c-diamide synthase [Photobacterium obscurum]